MTQVPTYLAERSSDVRDLSPWAPFSYVARGLHTLIRDLVAAGALEPGATVLDYGCADSPYRVDLPPSINYVGADLPGNTSADVELRSDGTLPLADNSVDLVLSTQVLEHVDQPQLYLSECFRVLSPGGTLVVSTHGIMYYHRDPEDHWRWTRTGLERILTAEGFTVRQMRGLMGLSAAAIQLFQVATAAKVPGFLRRPYVFVMQKLIALFDRFYSEEARVDNGLVIAARAQKPRAGDGAG
jgi:SAM-dependent methyltransferase